MFFILAFFKIKFSVSPRGNILFRKVKYYKQRDIQKFIATELPSFMQKLRNNKDNKRARATGMNL